jgi:hypothetical protein
MRHTTCTEQVSVGEVLWTCRKVLSSNLDPDILIDFIVVLRSPTRQIPVYYCISNRPRPLPSQSFSF